MKMNVGYKTPIQLYFLWHVDYAGIAVSFVRHVFKQISRDISNPNERFIGIPIFCSVCSKDSKLQLDFERAQKTVIFPFFSNVSVVNEEWKKCTTALFTSELDERVTIVPLANTGKVNNYFKRFNNINIIYFDSKEDKEENYTEIYHSIVCTLLSNSKSLRIFLSHTKRDESAKILVAKLNYFIGSNTTLKKFFDVNDIRKGQSIGKAIEENIGEDSAFLTICSDSYESRYWCQWEILIAKKYRCPILSLDIENNIIPRRFPFLGNVPSVRVDLSSKDKTNSALFTYILNLILIETIKMRFLDRLYNVYEEAGIISSSSVKLLRAPEPADICEILIKRAQADSTEAIDVYYPEPLVYSKELSVYGDKLLHLTTPMSSVINVRKINYKVGISISDPEEQYLYEAGVLDAHVSSLAQDIGRYCMAAGFELVYGGDFRKGGITEFLVQEAYSWNDKMGVKGENIRIQNHVAWPIYNGEVYRNSSLEAEYINELKIIKHQRPSTCFSNEHAENDYFEADSAQNNFLWCKSLTAMRKKIVDVADIRICAGGKITGYKGRMPGVAEEILITLRAGKPLFLVGGFGGVVAFVCRQLLANESNTGEVKELTLDWQIKQSDLYGETYRYAKGNDDNFSDDYIRLRELLQFGNLNNGLTKEENMRLMKTQFVDEAMWLIYRGINSLKEG